jgi:ATP-dependent RNA helicase DDX35
MMSTTNTNNQGFWKPKPVSHEQILRDESSSQSDWPSYAPFNFASAPLAQQRLLLPIYKHKKQIMYALESHQVLVLVGETGSGKSTQIPQYLLEQGWADRGFQVVCTQPRRIAAQTLAQRVASEVGHRPLGQDVGYTVRFDDVSSHCTRVKFVTDGILLREATLHDPLLSKYSVIMVDEAHERTLNSDALLGILKKISRKRNDLRSIVCSATIDAEAFLNFFVPNKPKIDERPRKRRWGPRIGEETTDDADQTSTTKEMKGTIISVDGRQHPVDMLYLAEPVPDYIRCTVETALEILAQEGGEDILAFLPSGEDIDTAIRMSEDHLAEMELKNKQKQVVLLPLYGTLPYQMQARVFSPKVDRTTRRIIFATNIAETSVTVPDITHVIDCGYAKIPYFDPKTGFDRLIVAPISQASARQRAGRAGRVQSGTCYRLYTEKYMMDRMEAATPPEVLRSNLTGFLLTLKALGVDNILAFDLMDLPSIDALSHGLESLYALGALDDHTNLTKVGLSMSAFPTEPRVSKMILLAIEEGCASEVLCVAGALQVRALILQPRTTRQKLDYEAAMSDLADPSGDHVTYANVMMEMEDDGLGAEECKERFINYIALKRAMEVKDQLSRFVRRYGRVERMNVSGDDQGERSKAIRRCVTAGFFFQVAKLANDGRYYTVRGKHMVTPASSSVLHSHGAPSEYIVFGETSDGPRGGIDIRSCSTIEAKWLRELAPHYWD